MSNHLFNKKNKVKYEKKQSLFDATIRSNGYWV